MTRLWELLGTLVPSSPKSPVTAALRRYGELREHVMAAGMGAT